ncbi:putative membrane protein [Golovinomyces cichoracearum]|uniref:Putative membrane protein n=1 Tax=Golovinomyces cichoracearum TaxID=62708 RepID=A0A420J9K0_9PEZI|nr:putative membrane protein [Golovinomyces cichoracearum]
MVLGSKSVIFLPGTWRTEEFQSIDCHEDSSLGYSETSPLLGNGIRGDTESLDKISGYESAKNNEKLCWWRKPSMYWLLPPYFLYAVTMGSILVPRLSLIVNLLCRSQLIKESANDTNFILPIDFDQNPKCKVPEIQALAVKFTLCMTIINSILSALISPKLGALSDRYGRLRILAITSLGALAADIVTVLVAKRPETFNYRWLLFSSLLDGGCGSFSTCSAITHAYATDCTKTSKRAVAFGYFHASLFSGIALGPLLAALLVRHTHSNISIFFATIAIHITFISFVLFIAPESLTITHRDKVQEKFVADKDIRHWTAFSDRKTFHKKSNLMAPFRVFFASSLKTFKSSRRNLVKLVAVDAIVSGISMNSATVVILYLGYKYSWDTTTLSVFTSTIYSCRVCALIVIHPLFQYLFKKYYNSRRSRFLDSVAEQQVLGFNLVDLSMITCGIIFEMIGFIGYATVRKSLLFVAAGVVGSMGTMTSPTLKSAITKQVPQDEVGQLLGSLGLLQSLMRILFPLLLNLVYASTVANLPEAVFVVLACCLGFALLMSLSMRKTFAFLPLE